MSCMEFDFQDRWNCFEFPGIVPLIVYDKKSKDAETENYFLAPFTPSFQKLAKGVYINGLKVFGFFSGKKNYE